MLFIYSIIINLFIIYFCLIDLFIYLIRFEYSNRRFYLSILRNRRLTVSIFQILSFFVIKISSCYSQSFFSRFELLFNIN